MGGFSELIKHFDKTRSYIFDFFIYGFKRREDFQNKGYGTYLLKTVLTVLKEHGYCEFTVGVEDDNFRAIHMYQALGFDEILLRKQEEYQGDAYEYNLYLRR